MTQKNAEDVKQDLQIAREELNRAAVHVSDSIRVAFERLAKRGDASASDVSEIRALTKKLESINEDVSDVAVAEKKSRASKSEE